MFLLGYHKTNMQQLVFLRPYSGPRCTWENVAEGSGFPGDLNTLSIVNDVKLKILYS